jgi:hypothetical protein
LIKMPMYTNMLVQSLQGLVYGCPLCSEVVQVKFTYLLFEFEYGYAERR